MSTWRRHPVVIEINAWVWLMEQQALEGQALTLADVPGSALDEIAGWGVDAVWLMGVWQRSALGRGIARSHPGLQGEFDRSLPDRDDDDVVGSPYAIAAYRVDDRLGGDASLAVLRQRLARRGIKLILDFVPNHVARDHPWVLGRPELMVQGSWQDLRDEPGNWFTAGGPVLAHGRDPYFSGWTDTAQLDYRKPAARRAMADLLCDVARHCDGVRCDMAMLLLPDIFVQTWGGDWQGPDFRHDAISRVRSSHPDFLLMAEVYWDLEHRLLDAGFDHAYDKTLYDRLRKGDADGVRDHLSAPSSWQARLVRFVENHDEPRARHAFGDRASRVAALVALALPGLRLVHEGQMAGRLVRVPVQLARRSAEPVEATTRQFYQRLLTALQAPVFHDGEWTLLQPREEWEGNSSWRHLVAYAWVCGDERWLVVANLVADGVQGFVPLGCLDLRGSAWRFSDVLHTDTYVRDGDSLDGRGLYLDLPGHHCHLFRIEPFAG